MMLMKMVNRFSWIFQAGRRNVVVRDLTWLRGSWSGGTYWSQTGPLTRQTRSSHSPPGTLGAGSSQLQSHHNPSTLMFNKQILFFVQPRVFSSWRSQHLILIMKPKVF